MSVKHPVISVTGSSGAGTSTAKTALEHLFRREKVTPAIVEGDCFHKFDRMEFRAKAKEYEAAGKRLSHFSDDANLFGKIGDLFKNYGETGISQARTYVHDDEEAKFYGVEAGKFTDWRDVGEGSDLLFYEGLHGAVEEARPYVDLSMGIVPVVNLEWVQKIHRDTAMRGYSSEAVVENILSRMHDYVHFITPQFTYTDINFQRVPLVDTSNPFIARDVPTPDESLVVIRIRKPEQWGIDFPWLTSMLKDSFMSRRNTLVVPAGKMMLAMEMILAPILHDLLENKRKS
ncbi:MAG: phosphoribulokinase [Zetaproteobacteria bacterium CG_4_9_14_3_um_filter_49_83]|nr:MAG: phosphoribulokinase [Zetaproteobacteria bacterium CG1_02_49_23]PIQ29901.1 MAG: phosphoribulokinase [Zetaproteobacteria bacterium CG17_big_fil_post_rev_8_21_14_2_50_50_13]PIV31030.1 MAG: phosphoribulokinase [Zetaproteobacteria bacterium CG02_land_8_20_14_3_00_50_9]PIY55213.1 MAG: phosphoribulokinase [Zetaproteobacteria bacterium CG_4_10_14_0_8_um_filter_49_80]PJA36223.1 MAG: phosphoribulokinase [Zetaproteobacteria bacterium CG_4_9_14_3_um_filter_49_83]